METTYIKLPNGQFIPDRRSDTMDLHHGLVKLIGKVETMENNLEIKLESVKDKISNLEEKVFNNIELKGKHIDELEKKIDDHCEDEDSVNDVLIEHDKNWEVAKQYVTRIQNLEKKYSTLEIRVDTLEKMPMVKKAGLVDGVSTSIKNAVFIAIGGGVVGIIGMIILQYIRTL